MKFNHRCEFMGCNKSANHRLRNGHWVCNEHAKRLRRVRKSLGHNVFYKEIRIGCLGKGISICNVIPIKFA